MSYVPEPQEIQRSWHVVDAEGVTLGKLATRVAMILQGKNKPTYTPFMDTGDFVVVINSDKARLSGKKMSDRIYRRYTGWMGGLRTRTTEEVLARHPTEAVELAIRRMMPKTVLGRKMMKKLKVYPSTASFDGEKHPHKAQQPQPLTI